MTTNPYVFVSLILIVGAISSLVLISFLRFLDNRFNKKLESKAPMKRQSILIAFAISWCFAFSLGCVFVVGMANAEHDKEIFNLRWLAEVIFIMMYPVGLSLCTFAAILATPLATRALRTGTRNLTMYGSLFWIVLGCYIFLAPSFNKDGLALFCGVLLSAIGLIAIGQIPPRKAE